VFFDLKITSSKKVFAYAELLKLSSTIKLSVVIPKLCKTNQIIKTLPLFFVELGRVIN
jgi:hypothetical protein